MQMRNRAADGLRGIASLVVALSHFVHAFWPALMRHGYPAGEVDVQRMSVVEWVLSSPPATIFFNGHFAVLIFFVLSGFVLSKPAIDGEYTSVRSRAWGRYFRLNIPIAAASLLSWMILAAGLNWNHEAAAISSSDWFAEYFKRDVSILTLLRASLYGGLMGSTVLIPPVWSLKVPRIAAIAGYPRSFAVEKGQSSSFGRLLPGYCCFQAKRLYLLLVFFCRCGNELPAYVSLGWSLFCCLGPDFWCLSIQQRPVLLGAKLPGS